MPSRRSSDLSRAVGAAQERERHGAGIAGRDGRRRPASEGTAEQAAQGNRQSHRTSDRSGSGGPDYIRTLDPRPGLRYNKVQARLIEPDVAFVKHGDEWLVIMNDEDL